MSVKRVVLIGSALVLLASPLFVASNGVGTVLSPPEALEKPGQSIVPASTPAAKSDPDVSALRYYARANNLTRVAAEIRRLKAEFPDWTPPDDLYSEPAASVNEAPLWALFASKDFAGIEAMLADLKQKNPTWAPTQDFESKYQHAVLARALITKSDAQQFSDVVALATSRDGVVTCSDLDLSWRVAEAYARIGDKDKALMVYRFLLQTCSGDAERQATAQKAVMQLDDPSAIEAIIALGHKRPDGRSEFEAMRADVLRRQIGAALAGTGAAVLDATRLAAFENATRINRSAEDAQLLGWYQRKRAVHDLALGWFQLALDIKATPKAAEGAVLTLRDLGRIAEAEKLAYDWAARSTDLRGLYIEIVSASLTTAIPEVNPVIAQPRLAASAVNARPSRNDPFVLPGTAVASSTPSADLDLDRLGRFKAEVERASSALGAQSLGWTLYRAGGVEASAFWFQKSLQWGENEEAALGLALAARKLDNSAAYKQIVAHFAPKYAKVAALDRPAQSPFVSLLPTDVSASALKADPKPEVTARVPVKPGTKPTPRVATLTTWDKDSDDIAKASEAGRFDEVIRRVDDRARKTNGKLNPGLQVIRAWSLFHMGKVDEARTAFESLQAQGAQREAREGLREVANVFINPRFR